MTTPHRSAPTRTLPPRPDITHLKREAKELRKAFIARDAAAVEEVTAHYHDADPGAFKLHHAQLVIARAYGFESWRGLVRHVSAELFEAIHDDAHRAANAARLLDEDPELVTQRYPFKMRIGNVGLVGPQRPLVHAWLLQDPNLINVLKNRGAQLDVFEASSLGRAHELRELLAETPELAHASRDTELFSPLYCACWGSHLECARILLDAGADPNQPTPESVVAACKERDLYGTRTHLQSRCERGDVALVKLLLDHGADPNQIGWNQTALIFAVSQFSIEPNAATVEIVDLLLEAGADIDMVSVGAIGEPRTALHCAIMEGNMEAVYHLVRRGADLSRREGKHDSALKFANCILNHPGRRPHYSAEQCHEVIDLLRKHGARPESICEAVEFDSPDEVEAFLRECRRDANTRGYKGNTPLHYLHANVKYGEEIINLLVAYGANVNATNDNGQMPLDKMLAMKRGDLAKVLRRHGAIGDD